MFKMLVKDKTCHDLGIFDSLGRRPKQAPALRQLVLFQWQIYPMWMLPFVDHNLHHGQKSVLAKKMVQWQKDLSIYMCVIMI